jgi:hypothetical protein
MNTLPLELENIKNHSKKFEKTLNYIKMRDVQYNEDEDCTVIEYSTDEEDIIVMYFYVNNVYYKGLICNKMSRRYRSETEHLYELEETNRKIICREIVY